MLLLVSPLLSLMNDQVSRFGKMGQSAGLVSGGMEKDVIPKVIDGFYQLLFISPEVLIESKKWRVMFREEPYASKIVAFVVDEAHCVKQW